MLLILHVVGWKNIGNRQSVGQDVYDIEGVFLDGQHPREGHESYDEGEGNPIMQEDL